MCNLINTHTHTHNVCPSLGMLPTNTVVVVVVSHIQRIGCQPEKTTVLYTVANPARGLLNREKRTKEKVWQHTPPPHPPHCSFGENKKITRRIYRRYAGGRSRVRTRIPSARRLGLWVWLRNSTLPSAIIKYDTVVGNFLRNHQVQQFGPAANKINVPNQRQLTCRKQSLTIRERPVCVLSSHLFWMSELWTLQRGSGSYRLRCLPLFLSREGCSRSFASLTVMSNLVYPRINRSPFLLGTLFLLYIFIFCEGKFPFV